MIKAIIFDCFGVLILDSSFQSLLRKLETSSPDKKQQLIDIVDASCAGQIGPIESRKRIAKLLGMDSDEWQRQMLEGEFKDPEIMAYIKQLRKKYKTGILSNVSSGGLQERFTTDELDSLFDVVIGSADVGMQKPDPEMYELAADRLGVETSECVFIDDLERHLDGAREVGMQGIRYENLTQMKSELQKILAADSKD